MQTVTTRCIPFRSGIHGVQGVASSNLVAPTNLKRDAPQEATRKRAPVFFYENQRRKAAAASAVSARASCVVHARCRTGADQFASRAR